MHESSTCNRKSSKAGKLNGEKLDANERSDLAGPQRGGRWRCSSLFHQEYLGFSALIVFVQV